MADQLPAPGLGNYEDMTAQQVRYILLNADRIAKRRRDPADAFASQLFGTGSTVGRNLSSFAGFNPDLPIGKQERALNGEKA